MKTYKVEIVKQWNEGDILFDKIFNMNTSYFLYIDGKCQGCYASERTARRVARRIIRLCRGERSETIVNEQM